ncbi:histidine kinase [Methylobacterium indicum]|uniref:Response regulator n=1 Tax=Methylobacterium indicum TaxID=1775910 RepID=A0A8H9CA57_9HYPH|nr:histidine kinase [Methylobacterium indicum]BCM87978.1 response regulator [Methylobacterium indicum]
MRSDSKPPTILLVEDDALVGLDLGEALAQAGYRLAGPVATLAEATAQIGRSTPDFAVVDVRLKDGLSTELACELRRRGVPFLVHSACRRDSFLCPELREAPWLAKPAWAPDVVAAVQDLGRMGAHP